MLQQTPKKGKRQVPEWIKTHSNHVTDKGFASRMPREFSNSTVKRQPDSKQARGVSRHFSKGDLQMAKKARESCSTPLGTTETLSESLRHPLTPARTATAKRHTATGEDWHEPGAAATAGGMSGSSAKVEQGGTPPAPGISRRERRAHVHPDTGTGTVAAAFVPTAKRRTDPRCPVTDEQTNEAPRGGGQLLGLHHGDARKEMVSQEAGVRTALQDSVYPAPGTGKCAAADSPALVVWGWGRTREPSVTASASGGSLRKGERILERTR